MKRASITQVKNGLSALIDRVRQGESIVIEDRGVPVARLESVAGTGGRSVEGRIERLERLGVVRRARSAVPKRLLTTSPPMPTGGISATALIVEERRNGR